ncbi:MULTISPECIES: hypothetical protein [Kribbella]|nr:MULTISPECIES: hypothetical protein [Kribbella]
MSDDLHQEPNQETERSEVAVTLADLQRLSELARDLEDPEVMDQAWS